MIIFIQFYSLDQNVLKFWTNKISILCQSLGTKNIFNSKKYITDYTI